MSTLLQDIMLEIEAVGSEETFTNMLIMESKSLFTVSEFHIAKNHLMRKGWCKTPEGWKFSFPYSHGKRWTQKEEQTVIDLYRKMNPSQIAEVVNRSKYSVRTRIEILQRRNILNTETAA